MLFNIGSRDDVFLNIASMEGMVPSVTPVPLASIDFTSFLVYVNVSGFFTARDDRLTSLDMIKDVA